VTRKTSASAFPRKLLSKIKSPDALKKLFAKKAPRGGKRPRVVFTNGCFDIVHKGHVTYLERARALGNVLVVALNSDASVRRLEKGPERPINTLADRLAVIAALEAADYVTWFEEDTPLKAILKIRPDLIVKGGDWSVDQIVGGKEVLSWGGKVKSLPYIEGKSTTQIIARAGLNRI
jgi:rfaE bifunctional protein nucleotidyltransferase chain/domain